MTGVSAYKAILVVDGHWLNGNDQQLRKLRGKNAIPLSVRGSRVQMAKGEASLQFRGQDGKIHFDPEAILRISDEKQATLQSSVLIADLSNQEINSKQLFFFIEQAADIVRVTLHITDRVFLEQLNKDRPELRLHAHNLPPENITELEPSHAKDGMTADSLFEVVLQKIQQADSDLFATHTERFLTAPHLLVPLLSHLASLSAEDNLKFPVQLRKLSDHFRQILEMEKSPVRIKHIQRDHLDMWSSAQGKKFAFVDGGVAKIAGLPGTEPTAMRVGIYCVEPGNETSKREQWELQPFVVGDIIDKDTGVTMDDDDQMDLRRLGEAARYTLEPLAALRFLKKYPSIDCIFLHGPLINQFVMYDEDEPHFIPFLRQEFLDAVGITRDEVEKIISDIPRRHNGETMWRQFMAIYGYITSKIFHANVPLVGVVERSAGAWLAQAVLTGAVDAGIVKDSYRRKVLTLLKKYNISDDFLFGCVLAEGEYLTPTKIPKNEVRRARERWQKVVGQYQRPFATVLKTTEVSFPFRVEMNSSGRDKEADVMKTLYHTARLLPSYAFPVGLDIVDKYAKVPDWLSKNVSARVAAKVLNRTIAEGDARLVTQVRKLLAHTPRDFFYRPQTD